MSYGEREELGRVHTSCFSQALQIVTAFERSELSTTFASNRKIDCGGNLSSRPTRVNEFWRGGAWEPTFEVGDSEGAM